LTKAVLERGERVVATLRRPEVLSHLADKYTRNQLIVVPLDIRYPNQIDDAFDVVKSTFGRLDVVVNNGGHGLLGEVEGTDDATARNLFDVLLWGAVDISRKAVTFFRDINPSGVGGRILQISSMGGFVGYPMGAFYHAGKFGASCYPAINAVLKLSKLWKVSQRDSKQSSRPNGTFELR